MVTRTDAARRTESEMPRLSRAKLMARGPATFKQTDVTRLLKATAAAGITVQRIKLNKDGSFGLLASTPEYTRNEAMQGSNSWDEVLHEKA